MLSGFSFPPSFLFFFLKNTIPAALGGTRSPPAMPHCLQILKWPPGGPKISDEGLETLIPKCPNLNCKAGLTKIFLSILERRPAHTDWSGRDLTVHGRGSPFMGYSSPHPPMLGRPGALCRQRVTKFGHMNTNARSWLPVEG